MSGKRQLKKRVLAEAMRLFREHRFEVSRFTMSADRNGNYSHQPTDRVHYQDWRMDDLLHACRLLESKAQP